MWESCQWFGVRQWFLPPVTTGQSRLCPFSPSFAFCSCHLLLPLPFPDFLSTPVGNSPTVRIHVVWQPFPTLRVILSGIYGDRPTRDGTRYTSRNSCHEIPLEPPRILYGTSRQISREYRLLIHVIQHISPLSIFRWRNAANSSQNNLETRDTHTDINWFSQIYICTLYTKLLDNLIQVVETVSVQEALLEDFL